MGCFQLSPNGSVFRLNRFVDRPEFFQLVEFSANKPSSVFAGEAFLWYGIQTNESFGPVGVAPAAQINFDYELGEASKIHP